MLKRILKYVIGGGVALTVIYLIIVLVFVAYLATASPDEFGHTTYDNVGDEGQVVEDRITGSWFTAPGSGTVTSISAFVSDPGSPVNYKYGIYSVSDNTIVGYTEQGFGPAPDGWKTLNIAWGGSITAGENYYLVVWGEDEGQHVFYDNEASKGGYDSEMYASFPQEMVPVSEGRKYAIYATYSPLTDVLPTQPNLNSLENDTYTFDNTPTLEWTNGENADNHRLLVWYFDNSTVVENSEYVDNTFTFTSILTPDNYGWRVVAQNENGDNESDNWQFEVYLGPFVDTAAASSVADNAVTLNSTITFNNAPWTRSRFSYSENGQQWFDWDITDHQYTVPEDPASAGDWAHRTTIVYVAAENSSAADKAAADYQCDGLNDENDINDAMGEAGTVYLFAGVYKIMGRIDNFDNNLSIVGAGRDNTIIEADNVVYTGVMYGESNIENILIENLTFQGTGREFDSEERNGINFLRVDHLVIKNLLIQDFTAIGIYLEQTNNEMDDIWILNNTIIDTGNQGIVVVPGGGLGWMSRENIYITGNSIHRGGAGSPKYDGGGHGIALGSAKHSVVANNIIENSGQDGINVAQWYGVASCENILVQGNIIVNAEFLGGFGMIALTGNEANKTDNVRVTGNLIIDNLCDSDRYAIWSNGDNVQNCTIDNNMIGTANTIGMSGPGHTIENNLYGGITTWENVSTSAYSKDILNLDNATQYFFRGEAQVIGASDNGSIENFTTLAGPPPPPPVLPTKPVLYLPVDGSTTGDNTPYFEWTKADDTDSHRFLLDNDSDFSSPNENELVLAGSATHTFYSHAGDGYIYSTGINYGAVRDIESGLMDNTSTFLRFGQILSESTYRVDRAFLYFDTSALENKTISSITLSIAGASKLALTNFDIVIQAGDENYPHDPLINGDYDQSKYSGYGGEPFNTVDFTTWDYNHLTLSSTGVGWVNKTGITRFVLRSSRDIDNTSPSEPEWVSIWSSEESGKRPKLTVTVVDNTFTVTDSLPDDNYSWKVTGTNENGDNDSVTWTFLISTTANVGPNAPTNLLCEQVTNPTQITDFSPEFSAIVTDNDDGDIIINYRIQIDNDNDFSSAFKDSEKSACAMFVEGNRSYDLTSAMAENGYYVRGTTYYWRIKFWDSKDSEGEWSTETATFKLNQLPSPPTSYTDLGMNLTNHTPFISWTKGTDNDGDTVTTYVEAYPAGGSPIVENYTAGENCELGNVLTLEDGQTYRYRLRSFDGLEYSLLYTTYDEFRMNSLPWVSPTIDPSTPIISDALVCNPNGQDNEGDSLSYAYMWLENGIPILGQLTNTLDNSYTENGNRYSCQVSPYDGHESGSTAISTEVTVRGANIAPITTNPRVNGQVNPENMTTRRPTLTWTYSDTDGDPQTHYEIEVGGDNAGNDMWDTGTVSGSQALDYYGGTALENNNTYYWRVRTRDGRDWSSWVTGRFTTNFPAIVEPAEPENEGEYHFIPADEDATVYAANPDEQFGVNTRLYVGLMTGREYIYLKFDLVPMENLNYLRVELAMVADNCTNVPAVEVWRATNNWSESNITWNTRSLLIEQVAMMNWDDGDDLELYQTYYADVTSTISELENQGITEVTFVLIPQGSPSGQEAIFLSREAGEFHTLEVLYRPKAPVIPGYLVALLLLFVFMFVGLGVYSKLKGIRNMETFIDGLIFLIYICIIIVVSLSLGVAFT